MTNATEILNALVEKKDLTSVEARQFLIDVMEGKISPVQTGAILTAFRMKGESVAEVKGLIEGMREKMLRVNAEGAIDIPGTGGGGASTFNISTAASLVARGAGAKVAKHGNRAASSKCGSADVLEALGVKIELTPEQAQTIFEKIGIVFLFAPFFHSSMKQVVAVRRELKIRTIFNMLGPFTNPAGTKRQVVGVLDVKTAERMAAVSTNLGYKHLLIVTSEDGLDEFSTGGITHVFEVRGKKIRKFIVDPAKLGFKKPPPKALLGGSPQKNAEVIRSVLKGERGARRDVVVLNASAALYVAGVAKKIKDGIKLAEDSIDSGRALKALETLVQESQHYN